jgi:hypothetical protein
MKKRYLQFYKNWRHAGLVTAFAITTSLSVQAQTAPAKLWDKTIGGAGFDNLTCLRQTADGGYILGGHSESGISGDKSQASKGLADYWVVKTDASGNKVWDKTFGGSSAENFRFIQQTADGGYILVGYTDSGLSGDKSQASKGGFDYWIVKIDATGNKQWDKTFGGSAEEKVFAVQQTTDGGYIVGGCSKSGISGDKSQAAKGDFDYWILKLDATGTKTWDKSFGGSAMEELYSVRQTADGGYILGGISKSGISGDKTQASKGLGDYWVVKLDGTGTKQWDKSFGGSGDEIGLWVAQQTTDGGYILGGTSASGISGDKTEASKGVNDFWLVKLDATGTKTWDKTLGGSADETLRTMQQTADGGYVAGGFSTSGISGDKSQASMGLVDFWVIKLNSSGTKSWDKNLGATGSENLHSMHQTSDGGFILGGMSDSGQNGDKSQASKGGAADFWLARLATPAPTVPNDMGVTAISGISTGCGLTNQETIRVTINNTGTASQTNFPVSYQINNQTPVTETFTGTVASLGTATHTFAAKANLSATGTYTIMAKTLLPGDGYAANDAITISAINSLLPALPVTLDFETPTTGLPVFRTTVNTRSNIVEGSGASNGTASAKGMIMDGINNTAWVLPAGTVDPWTINSANFASAKMCINPAGGNVTDPLWLSFDLKQLYKTANVNTNFRVKVNGAQVGTTYRPPFSGTPIVWQRVNIDLTAYKTLPNIEISFESSVKEEFANGTGTANLLDNIKVLRSYPTGVTENGFDNLIQVFPNPSARNFTINAPANFTLEVTDLTGKVIKQQFVKENFCHLDLLNAPKGIYLLKIVGEGKTAMRKLVVE